MLPSNNLRKPIADLIAMLQALPPDTTYEEQPTEFLIDAHHNKGKFYTLNVSIVEGINPVEEDECV